MENISATINANNNEYDEFHHFAQNVAAQLRALPLYEALDVQNEIQRILTAARRRQHYPNIQAIALLPPTRNTQTIINTPPTTNTRTMIYTPTTNTLTMTFAPPTTNTNNDLHTYYNKHTINDLHTIIILKTQILSLPLTLTHHWNKILPSTDKIC